MALARRAMLLLLVVTASACNFALPLPPGPCKSSTECTEAGKAVCDLTPAGGGDSVCVQCTPGATGDATACSGATPACGDDRTCRKCIAHGECASDACMPNGACAAEADVIYLKENSSGTACMKTAACGTWNNAMALVTPTKKIVRVVGTITVTGDVLNKSFTVLGDASTVFRSVAGFSTFVIRGSSTVELYDSAVLDAGKKGIEVDGVAAAAKAVRCKVRRAGEDGVALLVGKVEIVGSEISGNMRQGVFAGSLGDLRISQSWVSGNRDGGIAVANNGKAVITSSFVVKNTGNSAILILNPGTGSDVSFNTIVDNADAGTGAADTGGISCDNNTFTFRNNIIYRNTGGAAANPQTFGACNFTGSFIMAAPATDTTLAFKGADDYHLTGTSPPMVKDVSGVSCADLVDFDGDTRPQGPGCELGADEIRP